ncbi:DUF4190 domain-containing protein [Streptomyces sp. H27-D2]|uniref:DUF4190 domain-containing protein n=1 Tax=Streptomyces sp. H27-D2 TaxID=3046304 RepID=UPI002DBABCE9|nr:DUF4190 domain-containing protein [Streptomyces sp. H27-D2]MEC4020143.1 DUF4190 domain-containing protein [Streptomyces sp. H27-D2]
MSNYNNPGQPGGYDPNAYGAAPQQPPQPPQPPPQPPQQPGYGYPVASNYPTAPPVQPYGYPGQGGYGMPRNGMGTAGLVCGIIGLVCGIIAVFWFFALILGVLAIIFGGVGRGRVKRGEATNSSPATAGIVLGVLSLAFPLLWFAVFASVLGIGMGM